MTKRTPFFSVFSVAAFALCAGIATDAFAQGDDGDEGDGQGQSQAAALLEGKALFKEAGQKVFKQCPAADPRTGKFRPEDHGTMTINIPHSTGEVHIDRSSITGYPSVAARDCAFAIISAIKIHPWKGKDAKFNFTVRFAMPPPKKAQP